MKAVALKFLKPDGTCVSPDFCDRNLNILAHAQAIELDVGSKCGGHGVCGGDRVRVTEPAAGLLSPVTEDERRHLSVAELRDGWRLACQAFPELSPEQAQREISVEISTPV
jgi:ferredoxin